MYWTSSWSCSPRPARIALAPLANLVTAMVIALIIFGPSAGQSALMAFAGLPLEAGCCGPIDISVYRLPDGHRHREHLWILLLGLEPGLPSQILRCLPPGYFFCNAYEEEARFP